MKKVVLLLSCFLISMGLAIAQDKTVSGTVVDETGEPVVGATVLVKGNTSIGTATDGNGNFTLSVPSATKTLTVKYLGYQETEMPVSANMKVVMKFDAKILDEIVITGMNIPRPKKSIGYAAQEVKSEDLTQTRQTDLNNALVGKISGVRFWGSSGATFDAGTIILRGTSALTNPRGGAPIYVVDGVITNVNAVNMDDVESVNVLKGPAATAIYGSRGGNGAVIITSKKGRQGKGQFEFNQSFGFEEVVMYSNFQNEYGGGDLGADGELMVFEYNPAIHPSYLQALNGKRYYDMENDVSWGPRFDGQPYAPWYAWDPTDSRFGKTAPWEGQPSDNLKDLYKTGFTSTTNLAFSKTVDKFSTRISFTNVNRKGVLENSDAVRRYFSIDAKYDINDRLRISADYKYTYRKNHNPAVEGYGGLQNSIYSYTQWFHRNVNIKDLKDYARPDGTFRSWNPTSITDLSPLYHDNPYALMNEINQVSLDQWNLINGTIKFDIIKKKLTIGANVLANLRNSMGDGTSVADVSPISQGEVKVPYNILGEIPRYEVGQNSLIDTQIQGFLEFEDLYLNEKLGVSAHAYIEQRDRDYRNLEATTTDGLTSNGFYNLAASVGKPLVYNEIQQLKERSIFGTGVVSWDNTYYVDFSLRNDWSSTLPSDANSYLYGGLSLSALVGNFLKTVEWVDFWKIRASMAQVGSTLDPYNIMETYVNQSKYGNSSSMRMIRNLRDLHIKPTISTSYEAGTEFRLFKNRFYGDFNIYTKDAINQIIDVNVTPASGYTTAKINAGKIRNKGYEISLGGTPIKTRDFQWDIYANWSQNQNILVELNPDDPGTTQYRLTWFGLSTYLYMFAEVGKPIGVIRGSTWDRSPDGKIVYVKRQEGHPYGELTPVRLTNAQEELGNVQPDATGGFGTSFSWKRLRLSMSFDYQIGGQIASVSNMFGEGSGLLKSTVGKNNRGGDIRSDVWDNNGGVWVEGVTRTGTGADAVYEPISGYIDAEYYYSAYKSSIWEPYIYDASYLKMRELSLTYSLPAKYMKLGLSQAKVSVNIQNPLLIYSAIPNVDASSIGHAWNNYMELGQTFSTRTFGFSLNLTF